MSILNVPTDKFLNTRIFKNSGTLSIKQNIDDPAFFQLLERRTQAASQMMSDLSDNQKSKILTDI